MARNAGITASPAKLKDGSWGARVQGTAAVGDQLTITTRGGKSWQATVKKVVWKNDTTTIVATRSEPRKQAASRSYTSYASEHCGHPCPVSGRRCTASDPCHDCA